MYRSFSRLLPQRLFCRVLFAAVLLLGGQAWAQEERPIVVVSIAPQKYLVERIAGSRVTVVTLVKPGADPHSYEPSPAQMRQCAAGRLWLTIGFPFENAWLPRIRGAAPGLVPISTLTHAARRIFNDDPDGQDGDRARGADEHRHGSGECGHAGEDPHVWLSPMLVRAMLPDMAEALAELLPPHAGEFRANAAAMAAELEKLHADLLERFSSIAPEKRVFMTFHPSWRYFAHDYGLTELTVEANGREPGPQRMKRLVDAAKKRGIRTLFVEPQFPASAVRAIAAALGAVLVTVDPLAEDLPSLYKRMADELTASFPK
jgi:zinc transport system substrate-binding protein